MPSDYARITRENIRRYGEEWDHLELLRQLYSDRTHFLFELLQNAEDAGASYVRFELEEDRLLFRHNGRPFSPDDVAGICGVGKGTKKEDLTQIGKFGVGFKSVYAITESPAVHSGDEHFLIEHYVRPLQIKDSPDLRPDETLFEFPFNRPDTREAEVHADISQGLQKLSARTLLFLRNIKSIAWEISDGSSCSFVREMHDFSPAAWVRTLTRLGPEERFEDWLLFSRLLEQDKHIQLSVEIAFLLDGPDRTFVVEASETELVVFFPTEKETHLGFLIQGPFRTTPARDNIPKDDPWNTRLIQHAADLVAESLSELQALDLLTPSLLTVLPLDPHYFPPEGMFRPIYDRICDALREEPLLPTFTGEFVSGENARLARGEDLRSLVSDSQLRDLSESQIPVRWLSTEITQNRTRELWTYLTQELGVQEITPEIFEGLLTDEFLIKQSDLWTISFYSFLSSQGSLWKPSWYSGHPRLLDKAFIRLEDGTHTTPFESDGSPRAFLPPPQPTDFPVIRRSIAEHPEARSFLEALGLDEPDLVDEVITNVLPRYGQGVAMDMDEVAIARDIERIFGALETDSQEKRKRLLEHLRRTPWLKAVNAASGAEAYSSPEKTYLPTDSLRLYFEGNKNAWFLHRDYMRWSAELLQVGIEDEVRIRRRAPDSYGRVKLKELHGWHERGINGFDPDCQIDGLSHALSTPSFDKSIFIWNEILLPLSGQVRGAVESSTRKEFDEPTRREIHSEMGKLASEMKWIPSEKEGFLAPRSTSLGDLPEPFVRDPSLAAALGMRAAALEELSQQTGIDKDALSVLMQNPELAEEFARSIQNRPEAGTENEAGTATPTDVRTPESSMNDKSDRTGYQEDETTSLDGRGQPSGASQESGPRRGSDQRNKEGNGLSEKESSSEGRMPVYVGTRGEGESHRDPAVERAGVEVVMELERGAGRTPVEMPLNNEGYDIQSTSSNGELRYIEVKSSSRAWGAAGVALTLPEFEVAKRLGSRYWLYVVERATSDFPQTFLIRNPAGRANQFVFDGAWKALNEDS